ncbi:MAG: YbjQ family protein [Bacteroidales bacterium]|nr:YbjQ family protein [Bacteroidales bacterium]
MKAANVKVTTTSNLDGIEITEYLEPITSHVVVGMNFFKDFLSGFSDFFGGKSKSYQKILSSINEEVINELRIKAFSIGANGVLGLKIDNDEISAQNKSMMMVTAMGTAVKANFSSKSIEIKNEEFKKDRITSDHFNYLKQKKQYLNDSINDNLEMDDDFWEFIKSNRVSELSKYIVEKYVDFVSSMQDYQIEDEKKLTNHLVEYFTIIDSDIAIDSLYSKLKSGLKTKERNKLLECISEANLIDFNSISELIKHSDFNLKKCALQILLTDKLTYEKDDLPQMESLISEISATFVEKGQKSTKKKALSSKEKDIWICECGKENDLKKQYCATCQLDIYGFFENEIKSYEINDKLTNEIDILGKVLK